MITSTFSKEYDKLIEIDLSKHQKLDTGPKAIQQIILLEF